MRAKGLVKSQLHTISCKDSPGLGGEAVSDIAVVKEDGIRSDLEGGSHPLLKTIPISKKAQKT